MGRTRVGSTAALVGALLVVGAGAACTSQVDGEAKPDPALAVARGTTSATATTTTTARPTTTRPTSTAASATGVPPTVVAVGDRLVVCGRIPQLTNAATKAVNDFLTVANAGKGVTPELVAAETAALAKLGPLPQQLRTVPGVERLPATDLLTTELPLMATSLDAVIAAIPQRMSAPFNAAKNDYNAHLDKIKTSCTS